MKIDCAVSKDIQTELVIFTEERRTWVLSEPDGKGLRLVYFDGKEEGKGELLGVVAPIALGYMTKSSYVEICRPMGIKFPDRPESKSVTISLPVTGILLMEGERAVVTTP